MIADTIARYQETFSGGDKEGWLTLFADDASLEDPVGTPAHVGREAIAAFWDHIQSQNPGGKVRMVQGPAVCGLEAAWAFELDVDVGGRSLVIGIIDHGVFTEDGRIRSIQAFWGRDTIRGA